MNETKTSRAFLLFLLAPPLAIVLAVVAYPLCYNVVLSFSNANIYHIRHWNLIGLQQYLAVFREPLFWTILGKTLIWTVVNVVAHLVIGVFLAVVLHQKFIAGKSAWRVLLILPWALPQYITALTWRGMFHPEFGPINLLLAKYVHFAQSLNLPDWMVLHPQPWLSSPTGAFIAAIAANIWLGFPFMMVIALGGLQSIPEDLYEAADIDGASAWQQFRQITAPLLRPVMIPAITLGVVWTFNNVNVVWLISNGGEPADKTHILVSYVYKAAFGMYRFGWAAALSIVIFMILFTFSQIFLKTTKASEAAY